MNERQAKGFSTSNKPLHSHNHTTPLPHKHLRQDTPLSSTKTDQPLSQTQPRQPRLDAALKAGTSIKSLTNEGNLGNAVLIIPWGSEASPVLNDERREEGGCKQRRYKEKRKTIWPGVINLLEDSLSSTVTMSSTSIRAHQ